MGSKREKVGLSLCEPIYVSYKVGDSEPYVHVRGKRGRQSSGQAQ